MSGSTKGGQLAAKTNKDRYGEDFYKNIGRKGGSTYTDKAKGFAANPALAKEAGRIGGLKTRRGFKWLGNVGKKRGRFMNKETGEVVVLKYSEPIKK